MKENYIIITIILLIIGFSGCVSGTEHYDGQFFSFDYPDIWEIWKAPGDKDDDGSVVFLNHGDKQGDESGLKITLIAPSYSNYTLYGYQQYLIDFHKEVYADDYSEEMVPDNNFKILLNESIEVDGLKGFDFAFQCSEGGVLGDKPMVLEYVILQNGFNNFTEIRLEVPSKALESSPNIFEKSHDDFMIIVNSLNIKS